MGFVRGLIPSQSKRLSRGLVRDQIKKTCYQCGKGFNKRLGRLRAESVEGTPYFRCSKCVGKDRLVLIVDSVKP